MTSAHVLVVDDDPHLRELVRYALAREGYRVSEAADGRAALDLFGRDPADLVVLDVLMPELGGLEVCRELRRHSAVPIVFLSSRGEEFDRVLGLELGGDDYVAKPFSVRELVSRVKAVLRRARVDTPIPVAPPVPVLAWGDLRLEPETHRCFVGAVEVVFTQTEFRIVQALLSRPGRVFSREELGERVYDGPHFIAERTLDSHIRRVRQKLREAGTDPVETVHGVGFRLRDRQVP